MALDNLDSAEIVQLRNEIIRRAAATETRQRHESIEAFRGCFLYRGDRRLPALGGR